MNIELYRDNINVLINFCEKLYKQINGIEIVSRTAIINMNGEEEHKVRVDYISIIKEYIELEKKLNFFIYNFLIKIEEIINNYKFDNGCSYPLNDQSFSYYFDSILATIYTMIELDQRDYFIKYFNKELINDIFPDKNSIGLWWEVNILRNRVMHFTKNRYSYSSDKCCCYLPFNSRVNCININNENNIYLKTTLIDIYKIDNFQNIILKCLESGDNPFDLLFSNTKAKGKGKNNPFSLYITNDIFFDYSTSGVRFINEIYSFIFNLNKLFYNELIKNINEDEINEYNLNDMFV